MCRSSLAACRGLAIHLGGVPPRCEMDAGKQACSIRGPAHRIASHFLLSGVNEEKVKTNLRNTPRITPGLDPLCSAISASPARRKLPSIWRGNAISFRKMSESTQTSTRSRSATAAQQKTWHFDWSFQIGVNATVRGNSHLKGAISDRNCTQTEQTIYSEMELVGLRCLIAFKICRIGTRQTTQTRLY